MSVVKSCWKGSSTIFSRDNIGNMNASPKLRRSCLEHRQTCSYIQHLLNLRFAIPNKNPAPGFQRPAVVLMLGLPTLTSVLELITLTLSFSSLSAVKRIFCQSLNHHPRKDLFHIRPAFLLHRTPSHQLFLLWEFDQGLQSSKTD